jgi:hypothetical protein
VRRCTEASAAGDVPRLRRQNRRAGADGCGLEMKEVREEEEEEEEAAAKQL